MIPLKWTAASSACASLIALIALAQVSAPAFTFRSAARSCAARLNAGSEAIFLPVSIVDLLSRRTAFRQSGAVFGVLVLPCRVSVPIVIPAGSAAASVWSSTGLWFPLELAQEAQFFQNPIVRASPPGGGWLSTAIDFASAGLTLKFVQRVLLSPLRL